eukprot:1008981-Ditylum_brightwellii.AAC.1
MEGKWLLICKKNEARRVINFIDKEVPKNFHQAVEEGHKFEEYKVPRRPTILRNKTVSTHAKKLTQMYNSQYGDVEDNRYNQYNMRPAKH